MVGGKTINKSQGIIKLEIQNKGYLKDRNSQRKQDGSRGSQQPVLNSW